MTQVRLMSFLYPRWFKQWVATCAAESMINEMRIYRPEKLGELGAYVGRRDYPWRDADDSETFWKTYRRMVRADNG